MSNIPATNEANGADRANEVRRLLIAVAGDAESFVVAVADKMNVSRQSVYKWLTTGRITPDRAVQLAEISEGRVSISELLPFIFK